MNCTTTSASAGRGTGSIDNSWMSIIKACPATPPAMESWSINPDGTPDARSCGALAQPGEFRDRPVEPQGQGHGDQQRVAAGQPRTDRDRAGHRAAQALARPHLGHHPGDVASPVWLHRARVVHVEGHQRGLCLVSGTELDRLRRLTDDLGAAIDGHRHDQPAGVVGVIADQVDPPRGANTHPHILPDPSIRERWAARSRPALTDGVRGAFNHGGEEHMTAWDCLVHVIRSAG
ncbi:MAG: hypothetical protein V9E89_09560 [Ilumatobacteraceae bacterium]